ncbi:TonB-dependent receptor [Pseudoxanthomonas jiangsuensis]|uniref:TonB-dependent receptor n=1 Tax=Pseudoxanthomonas jiangsuensis TaxID=619688 RepID=UPI0013909098|nr:TonB-dependent receptor [Pseudoxanthomonas jiangsuensis]KAF1695739.1 TonB-dependent receptor [Pseudoxanthomonas jiangsuensis]
MPSNHNRHPAGRVGPGPSVRNLLSASIALVLLAPLAAAAQDAAPAAQDESGTTTLDSVVVTGTRASMQKSINVKQADDHIVEVIAADNMGQLPTVTIAEALVRLPGVNGTRDRGNASLATVRGLGPRMTMGTVNGREIASSEPTRAVRWEVFPTEVVSQVKVYKTQSADLIAGGIAATVDVATVDPLDYRGPQFVGTAGAVYYDQGKDVEGYSPWGNRFGASWIHKVNDNLAVALGATYQKQKNANSLVGSWGYTDDSNAMDVDGDGDLDYTPWGAADQLKLIDQTRTGAMGALQWKSGDFELKLDGLYSRIEIDEQQAQSWFNDWAYSIWSGANPYTTPGSSYTIVDNDVVAGTLANSGLTVNHVMANYGEVKTLAATGLKTRWSGEDWTVTGDLSWSQAKRDNTWRAVWFGSNPDTVSWDLRKGVDPYIAISSNAPAWGVQGQLEPGSLRDEIAALALAASRAFDDSPFASLDFGVRVASREKQNRHFLGSYEGWDQAIGAYDGLYRPVSMPGLNVPGLYTGDIGAIADLAFGGFGATAEQLLDHWNVKEDVREAFVKAPYYLGDRASGDIGVRVVKVDTTSTGYDSVGGAVVPSRASESYTDVLPSATLNFRLADDHMLRLAAAKVVARPPLDELRTGRALDDPNTTVGQLTGSGGNPHLEPFRATQLDASYEWYFHEESMAAVSVYRKWVDSTIGYKVGHETIDGNDYLISGPFNGGGGHVNGVELTFQTPFYFIPGLENFGVYSNYSYVDSNLHEFSPENDPLPLSGLARNTGTFDLWYSNGTFEARLGYKYHSPYTVIYGWNGSHLTRLESEDSIDLSLAWQATERWGFKLQAGNLTDEPMRVYLDNKENRLANQDDGGYQLFGRRVALEATFRF